jgi:hypothetical protein
MNKVRHSVRIRGSLLVRLALLALVVFAVGFCNPKQAAYFLGLGDDGGPLDTQAPVFSNLQPCAQNLILNATNLRFDVTDPSPGTGINTSAATARTATGANLPLSFSGSTGTVDLAGQTDGAHAVTVSVPDNATPTPNVGTTTFNFTLDRTAPTFNFTTQPPATASSNAASFNFDFAGTLTSGTGRLEVTRRANADAECAATDPLWPQGTAGGQVSVNTVTIPTGQFAFSSTGFNGVPAGGTPVVAPYGFRVTAEDQAVSNACPAVANPNRTTLCLRNNLTWQPQLGTGFDISSLEFCVIHGMGTSNLRGRGSTTPAQPNVPFSGVVTGPGVVGNGQFSGTTDASGRGIFNQTISLFGIYTTLFRVTSGTITRERTGMFTVDASQGCSF